MSEMRDVVSEREIKREKVKKNRRTSMSRM